MTLAERIAAARTALVATKDALTALTTKDELDAAEVIQMDELTKTSERQADELAVLERAEKALAVTAQPITGTTGTIERNPNATPANGQPSRIIVRSRVQPEDIIVRAALVEFESHITHEPHDVVAQRRYPNSPDVTEVARMLTGGFITRAAQPPAMTTVAGWAQELVRDGYAAFMESLAPESVVPRVPMTRHDFSGFNRIVIPARANTYPTAPNLAGAFRAEGAPIRVGRTTTTSKILTPKSMGVIGTFTRELLRRSTPNIETAIRQWMLEDTAIALDTIFLDAVAGTAIRPAGIQNGIAPGDTGASSGNTGQDITNDLTARLKALAGHGMGRRPVWVMNTGNAWALSMSKTPTGEPQFPDFANATGTVAGIPVIASTTVPADVIFLIDASELSFAGGAPLFEASDVATVHEDDGAPNADGVTGASVKPIVDAGVPASPVRSMYQTNSVALKATWEVDWVVMRPGAVQTITGVAW